MFIISLTYKKDLSEVEAHIDEHIEYLNRYYEAGIFMLSGKKVPRTGGVIFAQSKSKEEIDRIVQEDPFFKEDIAQFDIIEFSPSKSSKGLEFLIERG